MSTPVLPMGRTRNHTKSANPLDFGRGLTWHLAAGLNSSSTRIALGSRTSSHLSTVTSHAGLWLIIQTAFLSFSIYKMGIITFNFLAELLLGLISQCLYTALKNVGVLSSLSLSLPLYKYMMSYYHNHLCQWEVLIAEPVLGKDLTFCNIQVRGPCEL